MSKKSRRNECCCREMNPCYDPCYDPCCHDGGFGGLFNGLGEGIVPIIFLLIACGSGILNNNKSYLIILLFLLCGNSDILGSLMGGSY